VLDPIFYWMEGARHDIDRLLTFVGSQPQGNTEELKSDIKRGVARICANPDGSRPEVKLGDSRWWLRRYRAAHTMIVYVYLPSDSPDWPGMVAIVAVRRMRVASVAEPPERAVVGPTPNHDVPDDSETSEFIDELELGEGYWFNFADYATEEEATQALREWIDSIAREARHGRAADTPPDAEGGRGY